MSGGAKPLWGSSFFAAEMRGSWYDLTRIVKLPVVANLNLDMVGGTAREVDSVLVDGLLAVELTAPLPWVAAAHPELGLTVANGRSVFSPHSDHFAFTTSALLVPSLSFRTGSHQAARLGEDSAVVPDTEEAARIVRLVFYVGREIANADRRPRWSAEGRRQFAQHRRQQ